MPVGLWAVNDGARTPQTDLIDDGLRTPRCDSVPRTNPKDDAGIWPQCGAAEIKTPFISVYLRPGEGLGPEGRNSPLAKENKRFLLTIRPGEAYIHGTGALSANSAIARL